MNPPGTLVIALIALCVVGLFGLAAHRILAQHLHVPGFANRPDLEMAWSLEALAVVAVLCELFINRLPAVVAEIRAVAERSGGGSGDHPLPWDVLTYVVLVVVASLGIILVFRRLLKD
jgi:hypothetical protein